MCGKCQELDAAIDHYRELGARAADALSRKGIEILIEKLETAKKVLHKDEP